MGFPTGKQLKAGAQATVACNDPKLIIIGLDTTDGAEHPLYDERIHTLAPVQQDVDDEGNGIVDDEGNPVMVPSPFTRTIARHGVRQPIAVRAVQDPVEGWVFHVIDGRQRLRAIRHVAQMTGAGREVPIIVSEVRGEDAIASQLSIVLNEARSDDDPDTRAAKAARLHASGVSLEELTEVFSTSLQTVRRMVRYIAGSAETEPAGPKLREAVRVGVIPWSRGWQLLGKQEDGSRLPGDEVEAIAAKALAGHSAAGAPKIKNNGKRGRNSGQTAGYVKVGSLKTWVKKAPRAFDALPSEMQITINWLLDPVGTALPDGHPLNVLMLAGEKAAAAKSGGQTGRKAQTPGTVEAKVTKPRNGATGETYYRGVNWEGVPANFPTEAEAKAYAAGRASPPKKAPGRPKATPVAAASVPTPAAKPGKGKKVASAPAAVASAPVVADAGVAAMAAALGEDEEEIEEIEEGEETEYADDEDEYADDEEDEEEEEEEEEEEYADDEDDGEDDDSEE
jgi:hypothetical protein